MSTEVFARPNCYFAAKVLFMEHQKLSLKTRKIHICTEGVKNTSVLESDFRVGYDNKNKKVVVFRNKKNTFDCNVNCVMAYVFPDFILKSIEQNFRKKHELQKLFTFYKFDKNGFPEIVKV